MVQFLSRSWRNALAGVASEAKQSVLIAAPYIKYDEAEWFCGQLRPGVEITTLANINADAVGASALDVAALRRLAEASPSARVFALPFLHAKVFIADEQSAIVTSGNLTRSAFERNLEYGVLFREHGLVRAIRKDMLSFARLGSEIAISDIAELAPLERELRQAQADIAGSASPDAKRRFAEAMRAARPKLASAQVGSRTANAVFGEAIQLALAAGPLPTSAIAQQVSRLMPDLCDDSEELVINGERYGKAWKHRLRNAQQHLKRQRTVTYDSITRKWALTEAYLDT